MRLRNLLLPLLFLPLLAQDYSGFEARIRNAEAVVAQFYRGESLEEARRRVNAQVDAFNERVKDWNARLDGARQEAEGEVKPLEDLEAQVAALDKRLALRPDPRDPEAVQGFNRRLLDRNALVDHYNALVAQASDKARAYEALAQRSKGELQEERQRLQRNQGVLESRVAALEAFQKEGRDLAFFQGLNALLAELRGKLRAGKPLGSHVERVRALRRELARWARAQQVAQENGLTLVEALVGDEPCCFIVDTGAQRVCLGSEIILAAGYGGLLGEEATLVLAGGQKIRGRQIELPSVTVGGLTEHQVAGSAVPASEVGIDGLLGQSFLQRFVLTLDPRRAEPLGLVRRP